MLDDEAVLHARRRRPGRQWPRRAARGHQHDMPPRIAARSLSDLRHSGRRPELSAQISYVVVLFASHIKAHQVAGSHILVQVIVTREGCKRPREDRIVSCHCPRPERGTMCAHAPACVFDHRFDAPLGYAWSNGTHSGHYGSHSRLRSRAQSSNLLGTLNRHKGLDSLPRLFGFKGGPFLQDDLQPRRSLRRLRAEKVGWQFQRMLTHRRHSTGAAPRRRVRRETLPVRTSQRHVPSPSVSSLPVRAELPAVDRFSKTVVWMARKANFRPIFRRWRARPHRVSQAREVIEERVLAETISGEI